MIPKSWLVGRDQQEACHSETHLYIWLERWKLVGAFQDYSDRQFRVLVGAIDGNAANVFVF